MVNEALKEIITKFEFDGKLDNIKPLGIGNINDSYIVTFSNGKKYTLQKLNTKIFTQPENVMSNIVKVTNHLKQKIVSEGGDPSRETLNFIHTKSGGYTYYFDSDNVYRAYSYIDGVKTIQCSEDTHSAYKVAHAFGVFQRRLSDFNAGELFETIPDFHNTPKRYDYFNEILKNDPCNRAKEVKELIEFVQKESYLADKLTGALVDKSIPVRVTHNDTKINNILFDNKTNEGICVIDLDTVMPGTALFDFGDMVRSGASKAEEDDTDLNKVQIDLDYYKAFVNGFSDGVGGGLTNTEMSMLALSAKVLAFELGIRFLGDYINGDVYFSIRRPGHNKDRAANQLKLLEDMENKYEQMLNP